VGALDDPAAGAEAGLTLDRIGLLAARADVGAEAKLAGEFVHLEIVVALVEAEALRLIGARLGPLDQDALERRAKELEVVDVRARDLESDRDAAPLADERALRPLFALSVGLGPVSAPPSGALPNAPSTDSHSHSIPFSSSYASSPWRQNSANTPASVHSWKRRWAELEEQIPVALSAFHCIPVRKTSKIASIASRSGTRGL